MYYVYIIENVLTQSYYIGYTKNLKSRWNGHIWSVKSGKKSKLYNNMRKYGVKNFTVRVLESFKKKEDALKFEVFCIDLDDPKCLNLSEGGEGGFVVQDKDSWKTKLSKARKGRKPALGMRHTEENRNIFSKVSRHYWDSKNTYKPEEVLKYSFKEANAIFGISKTHYYRLRKRAKINDLG